MTPETLSALSSVVMVIVKGCLYVAALCFMVSCSLKDKPKSISYIDMALLFVSIAIGGWVVNKLILT